MGQKILFILSKASKHEPPHFAFIFGAETLQIYAGDSLKRINAAKLAKPHGYGVCGPSATASVVRNLAGGDAQELGNLVVRYAALV